MEATAGHVEEALRLRSEGAPLHEAAGLHPASAEVEHLVTIAESVMALPRAAVDPVARGRNRDAFNGESEGFRTAWIHNHSIAHKVSRHPARTHRVRWVAVVVLAVILALVTGVGVALAAQLSDPDSPLYPVRLVSEKGLLAVTRNPVDRAAVHVDFANQRFRDVEAMAAKGKVQLALDGLNGYYDELRTASNTLGSVRTRDKKWLDVRNQLASAESKRIDIVETALTAAGDKDAAAIVAEREKAFNVERQTLDKQLAVETPKPSAPTPASPSPGG